MPGTGNLEALAWLEDTSFQRVRNPVMKAIYLFQLYIRLTKSCNEPQLVQLQENLRLYDWENGLMITMTNLKLWLGEQQKKKELYINNILERPKVTIEDFYEEFAEHIRLAGLPQDKASKARRELTGELSTRLAWEQPVIRKVTDESGVTYQVFEKLHGFYFGIVYSPARKTGNQQGVVSFKSRYFGGPGGILAMAQKTAKEERELWLKVRTKLETEKKGGLIDE